MDSNHQMQALGDELAKLRQQVTDLSRTVDELKHQSPGARTTMASHFDVVAARSPSNTSKDNVPKHPQFVGPTRPSYGLVIAERSLTRMGIPASPSPSPSGAPSPAEPEQAEATDVEFWAECSPEEMARLLAVFEEEVESVYPFINILELAARSEQILRVIRDPSLLDEAPRVDVHEPPLTWTDVRLAKLAVATGIAIEAHGKNDLCAAIAESVVAVTARISRTEVELKGIQLLMMLVRSSRSFSSSFLKLDKTAAGLTVARRASTTSTATTSCWPGGQSASRPARRSRWGCTGGGVSTTTLPIRSRGTPP